MKITIEHRNEKISIETNSDDITFGQFMEMQRRISMAIYSPRLVEDYWK